MNDGKAILALDMNHVSSLVGVPKSTLAYWERHGVFTPSHVDIRPRVPFRRIYSFRDVVSLRALAELRRNLNVPLDDLRQAGAYLSRYSETPWASLRFGVVDRHLVFWDPEHRQWMGLHGQRVLPVDLRDLPQLVASDAKHLFQRSPDQVGKIARNRYIRHNRPVVAGTRIPTSTIWAFHEAGYDVAAILAEYPGLTPADVEEAIAFERLQRIAA